MTKINKPLLYSLLILPAFIFLMLPTLLDQLGPRPWKKLLIHSGYCTLSLLTISLALAPLSKHFPRVKVFKTLSRHRRVIGITVFLYAAFHLTCVLNKTIQKKGGLPLDYFLHPVVYTGSLAFLILLLLTVTSSDWSVRSLGYRKWKKLHRSVYGVELLIFIHVFLKSSTLAFSFFIPLILLQGVRVRKKG
jgi:sulfoxide reductase heme-binding subunit YedZ